MLHSYYHSLLLRARLRTEGTRREGLGKENLWKEGTPEGQKEPFPGNRSVTKEGRNSQPQEGWKKANWWVGRL